MNGRRASLPSLLALGVAAALGSGSFAPASYSETPVGSSHTSSWSCTAGMHQDWVCSSEPGTPYNEKLEQIASKRGTLRGSLANLMQQAIQQSQKTITDIQPQEPLALNNSKNAASIAKTNTKEEQPHSSSPVNPRTVPSRSLADQDWIARLSSHASWPEDQALLPKRDPESPRDLEDDQVSEQEVGRSVLLTNWLKKARHRATRPVSESAKPPETITAEPTTEEHIPIVAGLGDSKERDQIFDRERRVYADDWLEQAEQRAAWNGQDSSTPDNPNSTDGVVDAITGNTQMMAATPQPEVTDDNADSPELALVSSITMDDQSSDNPAAPDPNHKLSPDEQNARSPQHSNAASNSFRDHLLAHQAEQHSAPPRFNAGVVPPRSVKSAHRRMPAFQMQLGEAQRPSGYAPPLESAPVTPPPRPQKWLPDLEVTPRERLSRAVPKNHSRPTRPMPWQQRTAPEQWQTAPSGTQLPDNRNANSWPAATFVTPDQIPLPGSTQSRALPPTLETGTALKSSTNRSWSLNGQVINRTVPQVRNPVPEPVLTEPATEQKWPAPRYTADDRLAPSLPAFTGKPSWPGANSGYIKNRQSHSTETLRQRQSIREFRRPPPVTPKDIYKLAAQEPPSAGLKHSGQTSPFSRQNSAQPSGPSSVDRLRDKTRDSSARAEPPPVPMEPSLPVTQPPGNGWQQASIQPADSNSNPAGRPQKVSLEQMLEAPDNSVSVQWLATTQPARILRLQQRYPLLKEATVVRFLSEGKTWHLLLTGIYSSIPSAMAMVRSPEYRAMAKRLNPWTRPLKGLKSLKLLGGSFDTPAGISPPQQLPHRQLSHEHQPYKQQADEQLPQGQYTIQWMEAGAPGILRDLRSRYPQLSEAEVVMLNRNNKVQYFLIQGRFRNHQDVTNALLAPRFSSLNHMLNPKPRPMASLRHNTDIIKTTTLQPPVFTQISLPMDTGTSQILQAPEGTFTIQWLAAHKPKMLEKLKRSYPALHTAETVHFRRNEKDWYVLIQGQYSSHLEATRALRHPQLQELADKLSPWTRSVSGLRAVAGS